MKSKLSLTICSLGILFLLSCSSDENCSSENYDSRFEFQWGDCFVFDDGIEMEIKEIDDQRCPCNVQCVWEGEFIFNLIIREADSEQQFDLKEKTYTENEDAPADLVFSDIALLSDDSCEDPVELSKMKFEITVSKK